MVLRPLKQDFYKASIRDLLHMGGIEAFGKIKAKNFTQV